MSLSNSRNCPQSLQPAPVVGKDLPVTCVTCSAIPAPSEGQIHLACSMSFGFYLCSHQPLFSNMLHKRMKGWVEVVSATSAQNFPSDSVVSQPRVVFQSDRTIAGLEGLSAATSISFCSLDQLLGVFCEGFLMIMDTWGKQLLRITV